MKNTFVILSISFMLVINACSQGKRNNMDFLVTQCDEDTIIKLGDLCGQYAARNISLKVTGMIDDSANVSVGYDVLQPNDIIGFRLGEGKVAVEGKQEVYQQDCKIVYLHNKATKGQLKIRLQLLSPNGDTLSDNE